MITCKVAVRDMLLIRAALWKQELSDDLCGIQSNNNLTTLILLFAPVGVPALESIVQTYINAELDALNIFTFSIWNHPFEMLKVLE